jgi:hypothetical protein
MFDAAGYECFTRRPAAGLCLRKPPERDASNCVPTAANTEDGKRRDPSVMCGKYAREADDYIDYMSIRGGSSGSKENRAAARSRVVDSTWSDSGLRYLLPGQGASLGRADREG